MQGSRLSIKTLNGASLRRTHKSIGLQERRSSRRLGVRSRKKRVLPIINASGSTGSFVGDDSWDKEDGNGGVGKIKEGKEEDVKEVKKEIKKSIIAGVDQSQLLEPHLLADPDSRFAEYYGVQVHDKIALPEGATFDVGSSPSLASRSGSVSASASTAARLHESKASEVQKKHIPAILLHGFGASLFSWERIMPKLAAVLRAPALAFDRPAFGFTSRSFPPRSSAVGKESEERFKNPYTVAFSAAATLAFVEFLKSDQAILIGYFYSFHALLML
jgi:hypothetical protein